MSRFRPSIRLGILAFAALALAAFSSAQTFGPNDQVLTIGATDFHPTLFNQPFDYAAQTFYLGGIGNYAAPLHLPDGAEITQMCMYSFDPDGEGTDARIFAMKLPAGGQGDAGLVLADGSFIGENFNIGYGTVCTDPMSYTVHSDADLDGGGVRHLAHFVYVETHTSTKIGGVRITWHRKVSDPPATANFADVPVGAFGFAQIEALAASGVTGGCGAGKFCPNQTVTRAQMAIFLAKALGLYWPN
jgi:hypothetical protein